MAAQYRINTIAFEPEGLVVTYLDVATDVRVEGKVILNHQAMISGAHPDYADDIEALHHQAKRLLQNALEDFAESAPFSPDDVDDDDRGMGA